jgi:hypothetical protein
VIFDTALLILLTTVSSITRASNPRTSVDQQVIAATEQFARTASAVNVSALDIGYREGIQIWNYKRWAAQSPADARESLRAIREPNVEGRPYLWLSYQFATVLAQRENHCDNLGSALVDYAKSEPTVRSALAAARTEEENHAQSNAAFVLSCSCLSGGRLAERCRLYHDANPSEVWTGKVRR